MSEKTPVITGQLLGDLLSEAMDAGRRRQVLDAYLLYRARAIQWRGSRRKLPDHELADPRHFEMRACGLDPNGSHRAWFFARSDDDRRELVQQSRLNRVRYFRPRPDVYWDICPNPH